MNIYTGRSHIPYRNSMMTSVLRDSLGGNCKTIMIATINPEASHTEESLTTCKFAQRVSLIKNKALINEEMDPSIVIRRLKNELLTLREEIAYLKGESGEGDILTPQQVDELQVQCREYCYDMNPESTLNIGTLTLTKIKDAFAIMKNLVLEALNKSSSNSSNSDNNDGGNRSSRGMNVGDISEDVKLMNKQVSDLKALLLQRDNEIVILVNMVKKGKTVEDVGMSIQRSSRVGSHDIISATSTSGGGGGGRRSRDEDEKDYDTARRIGSSSSNSSNDTSQQQQQQSMKSNNSSNKNNKNDSNLSYQQQQLELQRDREKETQELIIKRHLFGVSPPTNDLSILDDMSKSFEYFCSKCNLNISLNENKEILKEKIAEAKASGERANHSRSTINYLKNSIEAIRRERILQKLSHNNNNDYKKIKSMKDKNNNSDDKGNGDDNDDDENEVEDVETEEEVTYRRAIDQEKVVYKESFDRLRVLKPEIENIRKVSE